MTTNIVTTIQYEEDNAIIAKAIVREEGNSRLNIIHVWVSPECRGRGLAGKITSEAAEYIQARGCKIIADCSYADSWLRSHNIDFEDVGHNPSCMLER